MELEQLKRLVEVVARLRSPVNGCPWDSVQTNMSIRRYLIEEAGEYLDALEAGDDYAVRDELGDLLLQIVLNAQIAQDEDRFSLEDVAKSEADKMVRRHPHVFGESDATTPEEYRRQWEEIKRTEKGYSERKSAIDGVPRSLPALARAQKKLSKAARAGFEWPSLGDAVAKVDEELAEVRQALAEGDKGAIAEELGDLLIAIAKICNLQELQAEEILHAAIRKFDRRFRKVEEMAASAGYSKLGDCPISRMMDSWKVAKAEEKDDASTRA